MKTFWFRASNSAGFTIIEMMISVLLLTVVSGTVLKGILDMTLVNEQATNRANMHNGVRNATELLTQEVGQAGRVSIPDGVVTQGATAVNATTVTVNNVAQMFVNELIIIGTGETQETVPIQAINGTTLTVREMSFPHVDGSPVRVAGGFAFGVVPPAVPNGSSATKLKIFGDINGDGNMVYVEYWCDIDNATGKGRLYRNSMPFTKVGKDAPTVEQILIDNLRTNPTNPDGSVTPCFTYQTQAILTTNFVVDVAITLTVGTQRVDPVTKKEQTETKALLNVSPRNVFNVWQLANIDIGNRVQPMPDSVTLLLP